MPIDPSPAERPAAALVQRILQAFDQACDQQELQIAEALMACCAGVVSKEDGAASQPMGREALKSGYVRLWTLREPDGEVFRAV